MMSTQGQASEFYLTTRQLLILVTFISDVVDCVDAKKCGVCQNIRLTCPTTSQDGMVNATCSVNSIKVAAAPSCYPSRLQFAFKNESGILNPLCETPYPGTCGQAGKMNCSCVNFEADTYTYQLKIFGKYNGTLTCNIDCLPETTFTDSCSVDVCKQEKPSCPTTCIIGMVVGIALVTCLVITTCVLIKMEKISLQKRSRNTVNLFETLRNSNQKLQRKQAKKVVMKPVKKI